MLFFILRFNKAKYESFQDVLDISVDDSELECSPSDEEYFPSDSEAGDSDVPGQSQILQTCWEFDDDMSLSTVLKLANTEDDFEIFSSHNKSQDNAHSISANPTGSKRKYKWIDKPFQTVNTVLDNDKELMHCELKSPFQFFKTLITDDMFENIATQTNIYSLQNNGVDINTTVKEIETFIGIYLRMGILRAHRIRAYWKSNTRYGPIADSMPCRRFESLLSNLHFTNNHGITDEQKKDKVWKLRPWLDALQTNFDKIPPEEHQSVVQINVPFKGRSSIKQSIGNKPQHWGLVMWGRCGASGILYQFDVYQGEPDDISHLGAAGDVVMKMTSKLESGKGYKVNGNKFSTSMDLVEKLKERSIYYVGTISSQKLKGCTLLSEEELKKRGRGSFDQKVEADSNIVVVRWFDCQTVDLVSSYAGIEPQSQVSCWDIKEKKKIMVNRPAIVQEYNKFMSGVNLQDSLTTLYKYPTKSKRWYMYIFFHSISIAVVNSWLCYKRNCNLLGKKCMKLCDFQAEVSTGLINFKRPVSHLPTQQSAMRHEKFNAVRQVVGVPTDDVKFDGVDHLPGYTTRGRCKVSNCSGFCYTICIKCGVRLCLKKDRNCFWAFHKNQQ